ncbi:hypothetical protein ILYODFUR_030430 [Ilyodon furcidens]|uniref:Uncharacterized protein n=1 Tax=Ilyodon furcidens TaxID=33524 RepID=A0ABV0T2M8_9TELE
MRNLTTPEKYGRGWGRSLVSRGEVEKQLRRMNNVPMNMFFNRLTYNPRWLLYYCFFVQQYHTTSQFILPHTTSIPHSPGDIYYTLFHTSHFQDFTGSYHLLQHTPLCIILVILTI